jgi:DEAD/DEAH box helicase domain-containing protein
LPEQVLETQACWLELRQDLIDALRLAGEWYSDPNDYGATWPVQRDAARARDGFRCQSCGTPEIDGRQHDVHHKIPLRAFIADAALRAPYPADLAWKAANRLDNLVTLCPDCHRRAEASVRLHSGLGGVAALLAGVAPLHLMCDPSDLGAVADPAARGSGLPTITIYEKAPGGVGYAAELYESMPELLRAAHETLTLCLCERGCPGCVGAVPEHEYALDAKALAKAILRELSRAI